jgi:hypothetical protein
MEEFAEKRPFLERAGDGREKASWVAESTFRLPCIEEFEEEKNEENQPIIWDWDEGENEAKPKQGQDRAE